MAKKLRDVADKLEQNPAPMGGATKKSVDLVLGALKVGSGAVSLMAGLLAAVLILYSGYVLYDSFSTSYGAYKSSWDLMQYKPEVLDAEPSDGQETLAAINRDYRGWLTVYDSNIDYPVVQGENDLYYASHDVYGNTSLTGAIYLAAGNTREGSDNYNLIYGHHMDNGAMFGQLDSFRTESFYSSHREGIWVTESGNYDIYSFAVVSTDAYENNIYSVGNRAKEVRDFLEGDRDGDAGLGTIVLHYDKAVADTADRILALSTCASAETNGRLVVFFRVTPYVAPTETPEDPETPTTVAPTTAAPIIAAPTTVAPTTVAPTTAAPTTAAPTTVAPKTAAPTTAAPTSAAPTTSAPTTVAPKTAAPTTAMPTTAAPTTAAPTRARSTATPGSTPKKPGRGEPQPKPTPETMVKLTVHYVYENGATAFDSHTYTYDPGSNYYVISPRMAGYSASLEVVQGTITEDMSVTVVYTPVKHQLTIRYLYQDGSMAAGNYTDMLSPGESFNVSNPVIEGCTTARAVISGRMGGEDIVITVLYLPENMAEQLWSIDDLEVPLGVSQAYIQIGLGIE